MRRGVSSGFPARASLLLVLAGMGFGQQGWQRTYGGIAEDDGQQVRQTAGFPGRFH